ncbi:hypothetical protein EVAR_84609_1 [Eumeta japonica]|uniref:DUF7805 domain-containing protein n=1 Tax=Eumeta variegata TaxID=151549 RepID=A0A4C1UZ39_EUMVA|nr:hypothetical protein EVAR_84609_1 [Eumeta japonica]
MWNKVPASDIWPSPRDRVVLDSSNQMNPKSKDLLKSYKSSANHLPASSLGQIRRSAVPHLREEQKSLRILDKGHRKRRPRNPQHSLPPNTTCLYHMQGIDTAGPSGRVIMYRRPSFSAPRFRVWFSVLKFFVSNALNPNLPEDEYCGSHLNIWDGPMRISPGCSDIFCDKDRSIQMSRATSPQTVLVGRPPTNATLVARYCRERAPRTCEHALLRRTRACTRTESFLSKGDSMTLELRLTQGTSLKPVFFKALYEFVDLHQDGEPWGRGPCSRKFISHSFPEAPPDPPITFSSPRDVFLYGRGGSRNISCTYRFEANTGEVVRLRVWGVRSGNRLCRSVHSAHSPWFRCAGDPTAAVRIFSRPWKDSGPGIPQDCLCSDVADFEFTSTSPTVELKFDVVNMTAADDFRSFGFEASVEFVRYDDPCERTHKIHGASGELRFASRSPLSENERCDHSPWLIDPSPGRYLYLQIRGTIIEEPTLDNFTLVNNITVAPDLRHLCHTQNRIAVYAGGLTPVFVCPDPPEEKRQEVVEVFSEGWWEETDPLARHVLAPTASSDQFTLDRPRALAVELHAVEGGSYQVSWLELSRRHASARGGVYALSGECEHRCSSLDACIEPVLWCDGVAHCPDAEDERLSQCSSLLRVPAQYAAALFALAVLAAFAAILHRDRLCPQIRYKMLEKTAIGMAGAESYLTMESELTSTYQITGQRSESELTAKTADIKNWGIHSMHKRAKPRVYLKHKGAINAEHLFTACSLIEMVISARQTAVARSCRRRRSALQQRLKSLSSDTGIFDEKEVIC